MHICIITSTTLSEYSGGIERVCCQLMRALKNRGVKVSAIANKGDSSHGVFLFPDVSSPESTRNVKFLHDYIHQENVDILWLNTCILAQLECAKKACERTTTKLVYTMHTDPLAALKDLKDNIDYRLHELCRKKDWSTFAAYCYSILKYPMGYYLRRKHLKQSFRKIYESSDAITFLATGKSQQFCHIAGIKRDDKLHVINNPIEKAPFSKLNKKKQVIFVGRLLWQKRVDRILEAWQHVEKKHSDWKLIIVGDGSDRKLFENYSSRLRLTNVQFIGAQPATPLFAESAIHVLSSTHEGFGMVFVEAMQQGCIPITFNSFASAPEIIDHGINGILIEPFNKTEFSKNLSTLMRDEKRREEMAAEAIKKAQQYDINHIAAQWLNLFVQILTPNN